MRQKRAFEYTDAEKQTIVNEYFNSGADIETFADQKNLRSEVLQFWIDNSSYRTDMQQQKHIYISVLRSNGLPKCIYTEKSYFDNNHCINENTDSEITAVISRFFDDGILKPEYQPPVGSDTTANSDLDKQIKTLLTDAGLTVHMEQNLLSSEFFCKAAMYNVDPDPSNFIAPPVSVPNAPKYPVKQAYLRVKPCHSWSRPECRQWYMMVLCIDKDLYDKTKQIQPDAELHERMKMILDGYDLKEEYTPRHYKDYKQSVCFWGEDMMDYYNIFINNNMVQYIAALLKSLGIEAITDNEELNQKFIKKE